MSVVLIIAAVWAGVFVVFVAGLVVHAELELRSMCRAHYARCDAFARRLDEDES